MATYPDMRPATGTPPDWAAAAQATIRAYCGWHVAPIITETVTVSPLHNCRDLWLPTGHLVELEEIEVYDPDSPTGWRVLDESEVQWDASGVVRRAARWPNRLRSVRATMVHGYDPEDVPDILALADAIEKRARMNLGGVASQSVNGAAVSYQTAGGAPLSVPLLQIEKQALAKYKIGLGRIAG